ncbi:hypothetical protein [Paraburkholderia rhynchosiae]|uniref:hypothetical protein n=1 Tax=Paraburkholderia rhynchosiae TaxID=487049 RepID=UPI0011AF6E02|nr:hypothetical protein [Paraburkholderia rhynchosiae]
MAIYNQNNENLKPYLDYGTSQLPTLQAGYGTLQQLINGYNGLVGNGGTAPDTAALQKSLEATPGYQFQLGQGEKAINNSAAAKGGLLSGATLKDLTAYGQGLAGTTYQTFLNNKQTGIGDYQNYLGDLQQGVNTGLSAGGAIAGVAENAGNNISANTIGAGNAAAAGTVGSANAISSGISSAAGGVGNYALLNQLTNQGTSSYSSAASTSTPTDLISSYTG